MERFNKFYEATRGWKTHAVCDLLSELCSWIYIEKRERRMGEWKDGIKWL